MTATQRRARLAGRTQARFASRRAPGRSIRAESLLNSVQEDVVEFLFGNAAGDVMLMETTSLDLIKQFNSDAEFGDSANPVILSASSSLQAARQPGRPVSEGRC
eukprot:5480686-Prymnesium_polylepis.2